MEKIVIKDGKVYSILELPEQQTRVISDKTRFTFCPSCGHTGQFDIGDFYFECGWCGEKTEINDENFEQ